MWKRKELKAQAKAALKRSYWKIVLVTTLFLALLGRMGNMSASNLSLLHFGSTENGIVWDWALKFIPSELLAALLVIAGIAVLAGVAINILLVNPVEVGYACFRIRALREKASAGDLGRGFDAGYKRNACTLFLVVLYKFLWSLLLVVPGIIKHYEYAMIPYLLADHPEMDHKEVFAASKAMMRGSKWRAFVLDLSFILWSLLGALTLGIVSVLYVQPYHQLTNAALYEALKAQYAPAAAGSSAEA